MDKIKQIEYWISTAEDDFKELTGILMIYLLEGRYPEYYPEPPSIAEAKDYLSRTKKLFTWLKSKL